MITYVTTSIFEATAQTLVNPVNCVGVMGKGLAREFASRFPRIVPLYKCLCADGRLKPGTLLLQKHPEEPWILNFPTKQHWIDPSELEYIEQGLACFAEKYARDGITSIAFPQLGCGLGGLVWRDVQPLMERYLGNLDIPVFVHVRPDA